jgi:hypothetical protein
MECAKVIKINLNEYIHIFKSSHTTIRSCSCLYCPVKYRSCWFADYAALCTALWCVDSNNDYSECIVLAH